MLPAQPQQRCHPLPTWLVFVQAIRSGEGLPADARGRVDATVAALDRLLATVPEEDYARAQQVVEAIRELDEEAASEEAAADAAQLDKLL